MKKILIPTDFSENALHACKFGIQLAIKMKAEIHFLHVFSFPISSAETPDLIDYSAYQSIKENQLEKTINTINSDGLKVIKHCSPNFSLISEIENLTETIQFDLILMGLTGASKIEELFIGSNTIQLLTKSKIPVLAIPLKFEAKEKLNFAFAYDGKKLTNQKNINLFFELAKIFNSKLKIFHVSSKNNHAEIFSKLEGEINSNLFDFSIEANEDVNHGILEFTSNNHIDILGLIPRKHSFFDRLFHESYTREVANYSLIPVISLPE